MSDMARFDSTTGCTGTLSSDEEYASTDSANLPALNKALPEFLLDTAASIVAFDAVALLELPGVCNVGKDGAAAGAAAGLGAGVGVGATTGAGAGAAAAGASIEGIDEGGCSPSLSESDMISTRCDCGPLIFGTDGFGFAVACTAATIGFVDATEAASTDFASDGLEAFVLGVGADALTAGIGCTADTGAGTDACTGSWCTGEAVGAIGSVDIASSSESDSMIVTRLLGAGAGVGPAACATGVLDDRTTDAAEAGSSSSESDSTIVTRFEAGAGAAGFAAALVLGATVVTAFCGGIGTALTSPSLSESDSAITTRLLAAAFVAASA